jgi:hypothetical protein
MVASALGTAPTLAILGYHFSAVPKKRAETSSRGFVCPGSTVPPFWAFHAPEDTAESTMKHMNKSRPECHDPSPPSSLKGAGVLLRQEPDEDEEDEDEGDGKEENDNDGTEDGYSE